MFKVMEIVPSTVSIDLHRERVDPDDYKENNPDVLSVEKFIQFVRRELGDDRDTVAAGMGEELWRNSKRHLEIVTRRLLGNSSNN